MGQQQTIYVDGLGFIPIEPGQTPQAAIAAAQQSRRRETPGETPGEMPLAVSHGAPMTATIDPNAEHGFLGVQGPDADQQFGISLPPLAQEDAAAILNTFPQLAGLIAQFFGPGKAATGLIGASRSFAVPAFVDMLQSVLSGEEIDPVGAALHGVGGATAFGAGRFVNKIGKTGEEKVLRSLGLQGAEKTDDAIETLPKIAIREGAPMTKEGAETIRRQGTKTLANKVVVKDKRYSKLAELMDRARLNDATAPNRMTLWPQEAIANYFRRAPREFRMGQYMANPIGGLGTREHIGPALEAMIRLKLAEMSVPNEPSLHSSRGPVRRPLR